MMSSENLLSQLPAHVREAMLSRMDSIDVRAGETLRRSGDPARGMYQVEQGYLRLHGLNSDGRQVLILVYRSGNCFGESPLIAGRTHHHTTVALTDVRLRVLADRDFWELYDQYREIPDALCRKFAGNMDRQFALRELHSTLRLREMIAYCFATLAEQCGVVGEDGHAYFDLS